MVTLETGDATRRRPFTVLIIANPVLEVGWRSAVVREDPIMRERALFFERSRMIRDALLQGLPGAAEPLLNTPEIRGKARILALFEVPPALDVAHALVCEDAGGNLLVPRQGALPAFLDSRGLSADVVYTISDSDTHRRSSSLPALDDCAAGGMPFSLDGVRLYHCFASLQPGHVAFHIREGAVGAMHEFCHAISSRENGVIVDLYDTSACGVNRKEGRPVPHLFGEMNGKTYRARASGYPPGSASIHCELLNPSRPALMGNWRGVRQPLQCANDAITRDFVVARVAAKMMRPD